MSSRFEKTGSETVYAGGFFTVASERFRHEDGEEATRDIVHHPGAVGIVVLDGDSLWFVRQPREAIGSPDFLEIPAGKLDEEGESPLDTAKRELAEEIGKQAAEWEPLGAFHTSPGFTDEQVHLFLATGI
jgi:8-oxo-dGTP pyrophosphatase MutT (NUDIX family)